MNQRGHGDCGGGKLKSVNAKGRRGLGGERVQQPERMRKRNCCTRGESLFKENSPARALGNSIRRAPSAQATQSLTYGVPGPQVVQLVRQSPSAKKTNRRVRSEPPRTIVCRLEATAGEYF
jgi:hypothetical protein